MDRTNSVTPESSITPLVVPELYFLYDHSSPVRNSPRRIAAPKAESPRSARPAAAMRIAPSMNEYSEMCGMRLSRVARLTAASAERSKATTSRVFRKVLIPLLKYYSPKHAMRIYVAAKIRLGGLT